MTKQSYLKQEIRARMAITGESYSAAARAIAKEQSLPSESSAPESTPPERAELRSLVIFTERLAVLLSGAITMRAAFEISEQTTEDPVLKRGIQEVLAEHDAGEPMERAIADRPWAFPGIFSAVISNGVRNGSFYDSMKQMAQLYRTEMELEAPKTMTIDLGLSPATRGLHIGSTPNGPSIGRGWDSSEKSLVELGLGSADAEIRRETRILEESRSNPFSWKNDDTRPLSVYIGPRSVGEVLARVQDRWKFLRYESPTAFMEALDLGRVDSAAVSSILIVDKHFDPQGRDKKFEEFAATMAPHCFFGVVSYTKGLQEQIRTAIDEAATDSSQLLGNVYFIDSQRPKASLDEAVTSFIISSMKRLDDPLKEVAQRLVSVRG